MAEESLAGALETASLGDTSPQAESVETAAPVDDSTQPEAATTQPVEDVAAEPETGTAPVVPQGPIPFEAHKKALENARVKAAEEWKAQYGWAEQVPREQFEDMVRWYQQANADPVTFAQELIQSLQNHPQHSAQLRSLAAKALAAGRGQAPAPAAEEPQPDIPIQFDDGRVVKFYSAEQQAKREQWLRGQMVSQFKQELDPIQKGFQYLQQERENAEAQGKAREFAGTLVGELSQLPGFEEHKGEIAKYLAEVKVSDAPGALEAAAYRAWARIVVPKLQTQDRRTVLQDINRKANANTVNPAQTSAHAPKPLDKMSIKEALEAESARLSGG